jgi:hypothetical protein
MRRPVPLAVTADLTLLTDGGQPIIVAAEGPVISVTLPRLWSRRWALGPLADRRLRHVLLTRLHRGLQFADLTLQFRVGRRVVARLAPMSRPTVWSRLLGLGAMEVRAWPCLHALLDARRRAPANDS